MGISTVKHILRNIGNLLWNRRKTVEKLRKKSELKKNNEAGLILIIFSIKKSTSQKCAFENIL